MPAGHWGRRSQWFWSIPLWNLSFQPAPTVHILGIRNQARMVRKISLVFSYAKCLWEVLTLERIIEIAVFLRNLSEKCDTQAKSRKSTTSTNKNRHLESFSEGLQEFSAMPCTCLRCSENRTAQIQVVFLTNVPENCDISQLANNLFLRPPSHKRKAAPR